MAHSRWFSLSLALLAAGGMAAGAQSATTAAACSLAAGAPGSGSSVSRLQGDWAASAPIPVPSSQPPAPRNATPLGLAPAGTHFARMLLLLEPSSAQRQALDTELAAQQTPGSCEYHHWLTPQQFADQFANSAADVNAVADWLRSQGFSVAAIPAGRGWIEFSGTAAQVEQAFQAPVRAYAAASGTRYVLGSGISVPSALAPLIHGLVSLDGSLASAAITSPQIVAASPSAMAASANLAQAAALTPQLAAKTLNFAASQSAGTGESIAIATRSNIQRQDIAAFRSTFGLTANPLLVVPAGDDPGLTADQAAAELTASWAGAAAPGARIIVVPAGGTAATDGIDLSLAAIVNQSLAHTVVVGYSSCEAALSEAHQAFYAAVYRQAAAQGISTIAAAGDSGAAACHAAGSEAAVTSGYGVNALAATPWNTAVSAAAFANGTSDLAAWSPNAPAEPEYAGGGGVSSAYSLPAWQPALSQQTIGRQLPDLALPTALDSAFSRGLAFCFSASSPSGGCTLVRSGGSGVAAAIFGGISAALAQQYGPQGNLAPRLYELRSRPGTFADIQQGSTRLACAGGTPGCDTSGQIGYDAGAGYDLATGLGSPNAQSLIAAWASPNPEGIGANTVTLTPSPVQPNATYNPSASITLTATVVSGTGGATPTGTVDFFDAATGGNLNSVPYGLDGTGAASITLIGAMPKGGNSITAKYSGDAAYVASNSQVLNLNIQPSTTTTTVTPATTTPVVGTAFNVTTTVAVGSPVAGTASPTGTMTLTLDGATYGTASVGTTGGTTSATFSVKVNSAGPHNLQAIYAGDNNYANSTSQSVAVNASTNNATVTLTFSPVQPGSAYNPSAAITFTATVASQGGGPVPTGSVNFFDQATGNNLNTGPVALDGTGKGSVTITGGMPAGGNSITAKYLGDTAYAAADSQVQTVNIQPSSTTTTVSPATTTPMVGTAFNVTASVAVGTPPAGTQTPSGQMTLTVDGANPMTQNVSTTGGNTTATFSVTLKTSGSHNLQAIYAGDTNYATSTSTAVSVNASSNAANVTLTVAPVQANGTYNPSAQMTFTATVSAQNGGAVPTGTVNFLDQATGRNLNPAPVNLDATGKATVTVNGGLPQGGNSIIAQYNGDGAYTAANSQALTVNIQPSTTTATVNPATTTPAAGTSFNVTVNIAIGNPPAGATAPTGNVQLTLDGAPYATAAVATAGGSTAAAFKVTIANGGAHNLQAIYAGDTNYSTSTSASVSVTVSKGATVTSLAATPATLTAGTPESFTATIAPTTPVTGTTPTFTGTVTFYDGATQLGTSNVSGNTATLANVTLGTSTTHVITAVYSGDDTWGGSTSNALTMKAVLLPVTVALTVTPATAGPGQVVTLTATVTPNTAPASAAEQNPTGNVVFYNGTKILATVPLSAGPNNTAVAQVQFATLPAGDNILTAAYVGDLFYAAGTSNAVTITVQDFALSPAPTNPPADLDIVKGTSGQASFIVTGLGGFNSQISVVCAVPATDYMTCTANPQQVTPTATVTFTINTFLTGTQAGLHRDAPLWPRAVSGTALAALLFFLLPGGRRARIFSSRGRRLMILLLLLCGAGFAGMGCSSVNNRLPATGTPLGQTTLTITAATNIDNTVVSHSVYLDVNVLPPGATGTAQPFLGAK